MIIPFVRCQADDITLKYHFSVAIVLFFESIQNVHINFSSFGTWIRHTLRIKGEFQSTPDLVRVVNPTDSSQWLWFTEVSCAINIACFDAYRAFLRYKILRSQAGRVSGGLTVTYPLWALKIRSEGWLLWCEAYSYLLLQYAVSILRLQRHWNYGTPRRYSPKGANFRCKNSIAFLER